MFQFSCRFVLSTFRLSNQIPKIARILTLCQAKLANFDCHELRPAVRIIWQVPVSCQSSSELQSVARLEVVLDAELVEF